MKKSLPNFLFSSSNCFHLQKFHLMNEISWSSWNRLDPYLSVLCRSQCVCWPQSLDGGWKQYFAHRWWSERHFRPTAYASLNPLIKLYYYYYINYSLNDLFIKLYCQTFDHLVQREKQKCYFQFARWLGKNCPIFWKSSQNCQKAQKSPKKSKTEFESTKPQTPIEIFQCLL